MKPFGVDVSHHQQPGAVPWAKIAERSGFAIVRGSYGTMRDRVTVEHVRRARGAGLTVGLYHFYRPSQPVADQLAVFRSQLELASITIGDIVPTIDIEADPFPKHMAVSPAWQGSVLEFIDGMVDEFGDCMVYITQREFGMLGAPAWLLTRPIWCAHYTGAAKPATPGNGTATIWQHRVGPYDPDGPGGFFEAKRSLQLDQNRLLGRLPIIGKLEPVVNSTLPPEGDEDDDELEELIAQLQGAEWGRAQDAIGLPGQALHEHESIEERGSDTDPAPPPESEA